MGVDVAQEVVWAVLIYLRAILGQQQSEIPDIFFTEMSHLLSSKSYLLLKSSLKHAVIPAHEKNTITACCLLLDFVLFAYE